MLKNMNLATLKKTIVPIGMLFVACAASADDIDIYANAPSSNQDAPNVLIYLDNTANWSQSFASSTKFAAEKVALAQVINALTTQFNLGLMMATETGSPNTNTDGGYVRFAIQPMSNSDGSATNARNCLLTMIGATPATPCTGSGTTYYTNLDENNDKSNGGKAGKTMGEAYYYFKGANAYAGNNKVKADPKAFTSGTIAGPQYRSPVAAGTCAKNFIIVLSNGPFQDNSSDTSTSMSQLGTAGGDQTIINPPDRSSDNNAGDEWTRFLNKAPDVNAVTYTLEVGPSTAGQGPYNTALLQSMGRQGKGGYYSAIDAATLLAALTRIFNDIQAVNSVFASASLPLSADSSGAYANQVYMGVFRPDGHGQPRWVGNLKQYQFAVDANKNLKLVDSLGIDAAGASGFAQPDAVSFWTSKDVTKAPDAPTTATPPGTGGFWFFDAKGSGGAYDWQDGEWVEKGGAAQQLRNAYLGYSSVKGINDSTSPRKVFTCTGTCPTTPNASLSATPFNAANVDITDAALGTASATVTSITSASSKSVSALSAGVVQSISAISKSGGAGTVTTTAAHGFSTGDTVVIAGTGSNGLNGTYTITVTAPTTFSFTASNGNASAITGTATKTSKTATATSTNHGFIVGQKVTIGGATPTGFNGVVVVETKPDANTFTYTMATAQGQSASGTITATSNTATATAAGHGLTTGQAVTIAGATPSGYNGVFGVNVIDANTFTYVYNVAAPLAAASGTITANVGGGRTTLINWVRGLDTQDENGAQGAVDVRASIHGDFLHSRPVVINYASGTTPDVYVFYGGNDGVFRAIKGGQAATDGIEQWAFIPQEFFGKLKRQYDNSPAVLYPSTPTGIVPAPQRRDYFWDGPVGSYIQRNASNVITKAYLYIGGRRGGRFIYALDVTTPTNPKILWTKSCPNPTGSTGCDSGFAGLGQTWSTPQVIRVKANSTTDASDTNPLHTDHPVVIFGGGYDPAEDVESPLPSANTVGTSIYAVDGVTGDLLWAAGKNLGTAPSGAHFETVSEMDFSIPADVLVLDRTQDGFYDRVYAADIGGTIWRIDTDGATFADWAVHKIASVGDRGTTADARKFLFAPDVVFGKVYDSVVIGSGDREHPLASNASYGVQNRVYMFKDPNIGTTGAALDIESDDLFDATGSSNVPTNALGWFIDLAPGEKVINGPLVPPGGSLVFGTNQPCASGKLDANGNCDTTGTSTTLSCTGNLGIARRYSVNYQTGAGQGYTNSQGESVRSEGVAGGGFLPSPVAGVVNVNGVPYMFVTDNPLSPGGVIPTSVSVPQKRFRTYWKQELE
jgi:Tfp pilus tip-associated adhesin PilY1